MSSGGNDTNGVIPERSDMEEKNRSVDAAGDFSSGFVLKKAITVTTEATAATAETARLTSVAAVHATNFVLERQTTEEMIEEERRGDKVASLCLGLRDVVGT